MGVIEARPRVEVQILDERLHQWRAPRFHTEQSAGIDMHACLDAAIDLIPGAPPVLIPSGIALLMGNDHIAALLLARSGLGHKKGIVLSQAVGTIDADYTAEIFISTWLRPGSASVTIEPGDRIAQLVFVPVLRPDFVTVEGFSRSTDRGAGGFGSTGR